MTSRSVSVCWAGQHDWEPIKGVGLVCYACMKRRCDRCDGSGRVPFWRAEYYTDDEEKATAACEDCGGSGIED